MDDLPGALQVLFYLGLGLVCVGRALLSCLKVSLEVFAEWVQLPQRRGLRLPVSQPAPLPPTFEKSWLHRRAA